MPTPNLYQLAYTFLLDLHLPGVDAALLDDYIVYNPDRDQPKTMAELYYNLIGSAMNAGMRPGVIEGGIGDLRRLGPVLFGFSPTSVMEQYGDDWEALLDEIVRTLRPKGVIRRAKGSVWPLFCRSILTGARFLARFATAQDFYHWVDTFDSSDARRLELPDVIQKEITGYGYALDSFICSKMPVLMCLVRA